MSKKDIAKELDQWYTTNELAEEVMYEFYKLRKSALCQFTVEPAAGTGVMLDLIQGEKAGFDLDPKRGDIFGPQDFLESDLDILRVPEDKRNNF